MFRVQSYAYFPTYEKKIVFLHPKRIAMATIKFFRTGSNAPRSQESRREAEDLGVLGEQIASRWLTDRGYAILEKNYHRRRHEVDLIALDGAMSIHDADSFSAAMDPLLENEPLRLKCGATAGEYIQSHLGGTQLIYNHIFKGGQP